MYKTTLFFCIKLKVLLNFVKMNNLCNVTYINNILSEERGWALLVMLVHPDYQLIVALLITYVYM